MFLEFFYKILWNIIKVPDEIGPNFVLFALHDLKQNLRKFNKFSESF
jgi:hypothetical protein